MSKNLFAQYYQDKDNHVKDIRTKVCERSQTLSKE